ncbi:hypothetical protein QR680_005170 [Steinernema hermaphroditum]|uniref:WDHD1/CFT4 second beta-propeller domain-containing protein n=1 Tax=Steinernema hermaphroditum TaxID=289476 RepID=A0AA39HSB2_9BILA|nr:hypothetical protein QR680_005170 [Steinernema hermaphroditum]
MALSGVTHKKAPTTHQAGHDVNLCADASGTNEVNFVSYGGDSIIHVWSLAGDVLEPVIERSYDGKKESKMVPGPLTWTGDYIYVADNKKTSDSSAENTVWRFDLETLTAPRRVDERYPSSITSLNASEDGNFVICSSKEMLRSLHIAVAGRSYDAESFPTDSVRATAVDPLSQIFAVLTSAGKLMFFPVQKDSSKDTGCMQSLDVPSFSDSPKLKFSLCFSRDSDQLYVPSKGKVVIFRRDGTNEWEEASPLSYPINEQLCLCALSKGGRFLAVTTASNKVVVWDVEASIPRISSSFVYGNGKGSISSIIWNPADDEEVSLIVGDSEGKITVLSDFHSVIDGLSNDNDVMAFDDENTMDFDDIPVRMNRTIAPLDDDEDDGVSIGAIKAEYSQEDELVPLEAPMARATTVVEYNPPTVPAPFVSGAAPLRLKRRILKRNEHGSITSFDDSEMSQLEIRFHNTALFHPIDLNNETSRYVYGDLSTKAVALASARDGSTPSELYVHHIASTDADLNKSKWSVQLSGKESIQLVALGERFVAVYTSYGFIRIFSLAGTQRVVFSHPGPVLTMCATRNMLTVMSISGGAYFVGKYREPHYNVTASLYTVELRDAGLPVLTQQIPVSITPGSELAWAGYSTTGALCTMDSECCIRMLSASAMWVPILVARDELLQNEADYLWPIAVMEDKVQYFLCTDNLKYPEVSRKDVRMASWQVPMLAKGSQTSEVEGSLMLRDLLVGLSSSSEAANVKKQLSADVRKLFLYTLASGFEGRASELAWLASTEKDVKNICQLVSNNREKLRLRDQFCDKIAEIGRQALNRREEQTQEVERRGTRVSAVPESYVAEAGAHSAFKPKLRGSSSRVPKRHFEDDVRESVPGMSEPSTPVAPTSADFSQPATPMSSGNPFASKGSARPTLNDSIDSIFDVISAPSTAKRPKKDDKTMAPIQKQTRLSFPVASSTPASNGDENAFPKMDRWVADNSERLKLDYETSTEADGKSFEAYALTRYRNAKKAAKA